MNIITIAKYELLRLTRLKTVMLMLFVLPMLLIVILGSALSNAFTGNVKDVEPVIVGVVQSDQGILNNVFEQYMSSSKVQRYAQLSPFTSEKAVRKAIQEKQIDYGVLIPGDFSEKVLAGAKTQWTLIQGDHETKNIMADQVFKAFISETNLQQTAAMVLGTREIQSPKDIQVNTHSSIQVGQLTKKEATAIQYYAVSMLIMFLLFSGMSAAISIVEEREKNTLERLNSLPLSAGQIIFGKLIGMSFTSFIQCAFIIVFSAFAFGVYWGDHFLYLISVCILTIIVSMSLALCLSSFVKTTKGIESIFSSLIVFMTFVSGGMFPDVGGLIEKIGDFTINRWATDSLLRVILDQNVSQIHLNMLWLTVTSAILLAIAIMKNRKGGFA